MKLVADANVLFAALLRDGWTRSMWVSPAIERIAPRFILTELLSKRRVLLSKVGTQDEEEFDHLVVKMLSYVRLVDDSELEPYVDVANRLTQDPHDVLYLACALHEGADLWTSDKGFRAQKRVRVWTTDELVEEFGPAP